MIENVCWSSCKVPLFLSDFKDYLFSREIFEKSSNIKFNANSSSTAQFFHVDGQTDGRDEANSGFW